MYRALASSSPTRDWYAIRGTARWIKERERSVDVQLFDFMFRSGRGDVPRHKVKETWGGPHAEALWHFGRPFEEFDRYLDELLKRGWVPDVIVVTSLSRDFMPSSWADYSPTIWDWSTFIGTIGLFLSLLFLFIRFLPMISIFEMRTILPGAEGHGDEAKP